jgi:hypothetical protein
MNNKTIKKRKIIMLSSTDMSKGSYQERKERRKINK